VHTTAPARLALVCLFALVGTVALARIGEARSLRTRLRPPHATSADAEDAAQRPPSTLRSAREEPRAWTAQGDALRDGRPLDINLASASELELLPGVGPKLAQEIVRSRAVHGPFGVLADLRRVRGIGDKTLAKMVPLLRVAPAGVAVSSGGELARSLSQSAPSVADAPSKGLEHPAHAQRDIGGVEQLSVAGEQHRAAHVDAQDPAARGEVVDPEQQVRAGSHGQRR
jgi:competence ComEA-like helix-hairpin-helix protein